MHKPGLGVIIGRFQVPLLHEGHKHIIDHANKHQKTMVMIGCHPGGVSTNDPLDFATRECMIKRQYPLVMTCPLMDQPTNEQWSVQVDQAIAIYAPFASEVTLYAGRDSFAPCYTGRHKVVEIDNIHDGVSGTKLRASIGETALDTEDFRRGVIYCSRNIWYNIKSTVDIAMIRKPVLDINSYGPTSDMLWEVLLAQKANQPDKWRFPGGFMDIKDKTRELCARREFFEETGLTGEDWHHIGDFRVSDWRDTTDDAIQTDLFICHYTHGKERPGDDLQSGKLMWVPHTRLPDMLFADDHKKLAEAVNNWIIHNKYSGALA